MVQRKICNVIPTVRLLLLIYLMSVGINCDDIGNINNHTNIVINAVRDILTHKQAASVHAQQVWQDIWTKTNNLQEQGRVICHICQFTINEILKLRRTNNSEVDFYYDRVFEVCVLVTKWDKSECEQKLFLEMDTLMFMIDNNTNITGERVCSIFFQEFQCVDSKRKAWGVHIEKMHDLKASRPSPVAEKHEKILHITDIHYDPGYMPGSYAVCESNVCCQIDSGFSNDSLTAAGFWGDYRRCDMPWHSVVNLIEHIKAVHNDVDYLYFTGDIIGHKAADESDEHVESIRKFYKLLNDTFPGKHVYPILGDHEPDPMNFYSPINFTEEPVLSTQWLFDVVAEEWSQWLPDSAIETIRKGGYYTLLVKPGFRVIALNSNVCYTVNLWLFYNDIDPYGQLQWLADTLQKAEDSGESVHILSHFPPGHINCLDNWNDVYLQIVTRYAKTIKAQFNGHTHTDDFRLISDATNNSVVNVAFNGGSFTTFDGVDPMYKVYKMEGGDYEVSDYDVWTYNMSLANKNGTGPVWFILYSFKDAYGVVNMSVQELEKLVRRMVSDKALLDKFIRLQLRLRTPLSEQSCNDACRTAELCAISAVHLKQLLGCREAYLKKSGEKYKV